MNTGSNQPPAGGGRRNRRRRIRRGPAPQNRSNQPKQSRSRPGSVFTGPMDHSYRNLQASENGAGRNRARPPRSNAAPRVFQQPEIEPLPDREHDERPKIFVFVEDLFFVAKIQETARKLNIKVEFSKSEKEILDWFHKNQERKPALIIFDLNNISSKPLQSIHKLKAKLKRESNIIGFLSHLQGDLKVKALEAGCDMVLPRSAFSQNLAQLLRRHATVGDAEELGSEANP